MGAVYFYHLTERPLEATLPSLLSKSMEAGWRVAICGTDRERLDQLDRALWLGEGFLPHGLSGGPHDESQPILLTDAQPTNGATCLMAIDGAEVDVLGATKLDRLCILFDGADETVVAKARDTWRQVSDANLDAQYWTEEGGKWVKKAESTSS